MVAILSFIQAPPGYQIGCVFAEYDLFKNWNLKPNLKYISFGIILTLLYINLWRQKHYIELL